LLINVLRLTTPMGGAHRTCTPRSRSRLARAAHMRLSRRRSIPA